MLEDTRITPSGINTFNMSDIHGQPRIPDKPQIPIGYGDDFTSLPPQTQIPEAVTPMMLPLPSLGKQISKADNIQIPTFETNAKGLD